MDYFSEEILKAPLNPKICLSKQIADRITRLRELLAPGKEMPLPTIRDLAKIFNTCHITVHDAYKPLKDQGIIIVERSRGAYLSPLIRSGQEEQINHFSTVGEAPSAYRRLTNILPPRLHTAVLELHSESNIGKLSDRMYHAVYSKARRKLVPEHSEKPLSRQILKKLGQSGLIAEPENVFIPSRGNALKAVAASLLNVGDLVVMETEEDISPYAIFRSLGCEVATTGNEEQHGMDMRTLEEICQNRTVRAVFIRADSSWPFGLITSDRNRDRLIALSKAYGFKIIAYEFESEYASVTLPPRLSVKPHGGQVIFVSVLSRASRFWEGAGYVIAEPGLIEVLRENDALLDGPRFRSLEQISVVMHENGSLFTESDKLIRGHPAKLSRIARRLERRLKELVTVIKPECGRFIVLQFHKPVWAGRIELLSNNLNMNYYERNKHLKENQTIICLRIEYTQLKKAEWDVLIQEFIKVFTHNQN